MADLWPACTPCGSPKDFTGPDLDVPSLTYQSWHEARFGEADWEALALIPREYWAEYLLWVRDRIGIPVDNETALTDIAPAGELLRLTLKSSAGEEIIHTRKLVLATGQESTGRWWMPEFVEKTARAASRPPPPTPSISKPFPARPWPCLAPAHRASTMRRRRSKRGRNPCICFAGAQARRWCSPIAG